MYFASLHCGTCSKVINYKIICPLILLSPHPPTHSPIHPHNHQCHSSIQPPTHSFSHLPTQSSIRPCNHPTINPCMIHLLIHRSTHHPSTHSPIQPTTHPPTHLNPPTLWLICTCTNNIYTSKIKFVLGWFSIDHLFLGNLAACENRIYPSQQNLPYLCLSHQTTLGIPPYSHHSKCLTAIHRTVPHCALVHPPQHHI